MATEQEAKDEKTKFALLGMMVEYLTTGEKDRFVRETICIARSRFGDGIVRSIIRCAESQVGEGHEARVANLWSYMNCGS